MSFNKFQVYPCLQLRLYEKYYGDKKLLGLKKPKQCSSHKVK